ncbi:hypothetical protein [Evansella tamaricis]|uniref:Uncharacterized protein n=1 Tax=Evansella tamaricis TaxID=2069301 RepID=A0ABS6JJ76_9BACI|nr:hypothetical protein [Evansella tamaricis]MBU9713729.1 hypothetical protein [Evansella tamaricis]
MSKNIWTKVVFFVSILFVMGACAVSEEQVLELAQDSFEKKMSQERKEHTYTTEDEVSFYIPSYMEVTEIDEYNILLHHDENLFLLFVNDFIEYDSKEVLMEELLLEEDPFIIMLDQLEGKSSYLVVTTHSQDEFQVVVGYDGVKLTTITSLKEMIDTAEMMFDIAQSVDKED